MAHSLAPYLELVQCFLSMADSLAQYLELVQCFCLINHTFPSYNNMPSYSHYAILRCTQL